MSESATGLRQEHARLRGSSFVDVDLSASRFEDVNLRGVLFDNVAMTNATIRNACLGYVTIEDVNLEGMRINGVLVTELFRVYREVQKSGSEPVEREKPDAVSSPASEAEPQ